MPGTHKNERLSPTWLSIFHPMDKEPIRENRLLLRNNLFDFPRERM